MIDQVRVAVVQTSIKQAIHDPRQKERNVEDMIRHIRILGGDHDVLVFPELSTVGYIPLGYSSDSRIRLWELADAVTNSSSIQAILTATMNMECLVIFGFAERSRVKYEVFDSAAMVASGRILGVSRKVHLAPEENHYFIPGPEPIACQTRIGLVGVAICYDMVFPEIARILAVKGSEIIIFISSWGTAGNVQLYGKVLPIARALENQVHVVFCNDVSDVLWKKQSSHHYGESKIVSATGEIISESLSDREEVISGTLLKEDLEKGVSIMPVFRDRRPNIYCALTKPYID